MRALRRDVLLATAEKKLQTTDNARKWREYLPAPEQTEADLVRQWIDSGYPFHAARDHVMHNELMIGCTWAGRTACGRLVRVG